MSDTAVAATAAEAAKPAAVRARHAASLLVLRGTGADLTLLMGLRGKGHRFMPNRLVFPGGAVDRADATAAAASPVPPHVRALLEKSCRPALARALPAAAARELEEETGLSLGSPPELGGFDYLGRLITPPTQPVRFNARFFTVAEAAVTGELAGSGELEGLRWYGVAEALALDLAFPTRAVIGLLQEWLALSPAQRSARTQGPVMRKRRFTLE